MASTSQTIEIIFGATDRNVSATINDISGSLSTFDAGVQGIAQPLGELTDNLLKTEAAIAAMGVAFLSVAVNEASKFGEKVEEIGSLVNNTAGDNDKLSQSIFEFAQNVNGIGSASNIEEINSALYNITSNVGTTTKAFDLLAVAEKGAIVGATDLDTAGSLLSGTMNAYSLVTDDAATNTANAERVMAAMFASVQNGHITMSELSENMGKVVSTASGAKIPIETVTSAIAALTSENIKPEQAFTSLNALFKELLNPSKDLSAALGDVSIVSDGLPAVLEKLKTATGGASEAVYGIFSSSEAAKAGLVLINDSAGKFDATISSSGENVKRFNENYDTMAGGVADSSVKLGNSWTQLLVGIGGPLQESWDGILEGLNSVIKGFNDANSNGAFEELYAGLRDAGTNIETFLKQIAANLPAAFADVDFSRLTKSLGGLGDEFKVLFGVLFGQQDFSTVEGLTEAFQTAVNTITALINVTRGILSELEPVFAAIGKLATETGKTSEESQLAAGNFLGAMKLLSDFGTFFGTIAILIKESDVDIGIVFNNLIGGTQVIVNVFQLAFDGIALIVVSFVEGFLLTTGRLLNAAGFDEKAQEFLTAGKNMRDLAGGIKQSIASNAEDISDAWDRMGTSLITSSNSATKGIESTGGTAKETTKSIEQLWKEGAKAASELSGMSRSLNDSNKELTTTGAVIDDVVGSFKTLAEAEAAALVEIDKGGKTSITFADGMYKLHSAQQAATESGKDVTDITKQIELASRNGASQIIKTNGVLADAKKETDAFRISMAELAEKRYEVDVQANVDLRISEIEATTQRISAAFQATSESISSLVEGVSDLWGTFAGSTSRWDQSDIKAAALRTESRLDDELDLKRQMTAAVIAKANAEAYRLNSGEPLINIDAGELAPELYLVLDKILKYTQIKGTQEGLAMLVGL